MNIKFFIQRFISFVERYKLISWFLLLLSILFLYQSIHSLQKEQLLTKEREEIKQRVDNNFKKANLLKNKVDQVIAQAKVVENQSKSCIAKNKPLPNECENLLSKSVSIQNELKSILEQYKTVIKEVEKDNCFLYPDLEFCQKQIKVK